jgi:hypothetical protein
MLGMRQADGVWFTRVSHQYKTQKHVTGRRRKAYQWLKAAIAPTG